MKFVETKTTDGKRTEAIRAIVKESLQAFRVEEECDRTIDLLSRLIQMLAEKRVLDDANIRTLLNLDDEQTIVDIQV